MDAGKKYKVGVLTKRQRVRHCYFVIKKKGLALVEAEQSGELATFTGSTYDLVQSL